MSLHSGDTCPNCKRGRMKVRTSRSCGDTREQRLECTACGHKGMGYVKESTVWKRNRQLL